MSRFGAYQEKIEEAGLVTVFIAAEKRERTWKNPVKYLEERPVPFPYLLDQDRKVTKAYGVYHRLGIEAVHIARPATFVVDRRGTVQFLYVGSSQTDRIPLDAVLEVAKKIR